MTLSASAGHEHPDTSIKITQLYEHLELYSSGDPAHNTLFVLGQASPSFLGSSIQFSITLDGHSEQSVDELLLIDPPDDANERFKLEGNVAILQTLAAAKATLPTLETQPGGVAHVRIGQHYLDIYSHTFGELVHIPPLGILASGILGSDVELPLLAEASNGQDELDGLRQAAALLKAGQFQLLVPRRGTIVADQIEAMRRLANDVAYIHSLRRVVQSLIERGSDFEELLAISDSLLPVARSSQAAERTHLLNLQTLFVTA